MHIQSQCVVAVLPHRSCFLATSYYKLFRPFWQQHRKLLFSPALPQKCSQFLGRPSLKATCFMEPNVHGFSFSSKKGPKYFAFLWRKLSESPKTRGQSSLWNQLIKCAIPHFPPALEIYRALGTTAVSVLSKSSRMQSATCEAISWGFIVLDFPLFSTCLVSNKWLK